MNLVELFKALGDENRLRITHLLMHQELCVCEIEVLLKLSQSNVSRHLMKLKQAGLIENYKDAQWIHYKINKNLFQELELLQKCLNDHCDSSPYSDDLKRLNNYLAQNLTCTDIRERVEFVELKIQ